MGFGTQLPHAVKWNLHLAFDAWKDRRLGIDASGLTARGDLGSAGPNAKHSYVYLGAPHLVLDLIFSRLRIDPRRFTFVDLGSGKARVLLRAATRPFKRVEGVELSPKIHDVAVENVRRARAMAPLRAPVAVHNEDALAYALPETPLILFFFNPFERVVLEKFLDKLEQSLRDHPRECYFIYLNPRNRDCLERRGIMQEMPMSWLMRMVVRVLSPWPMALYRTPPEGVAQRSFRLSQPAPGLGRV